MQNSTSSAEKAYYHNSKEQNTAQMSDAEYITERLDAQMNWYDKKSSQNKNTYKRIKRAESVIAAFIPIIITFSTIGIIDANGLAIYFHIMAALAGVVLVVMNSFLELDEHYKLWKDYRITCEMMRHERYMYMTRSEPYNQNDAFPRLVEKIEAILNSETQRWKQIDKRSDKQTKHSASEQEESK